MTSTTYVYEGVEIRLTGRKAVKQTRSGARTLELVEITPTDTTFDWKKWVAVDQLYEVTDEGKIP